ncbi:MAG: histidine kinase [Desulfitobacterium hafniense]|nr:histidine kinase [Desulfitobacterium hafniense]
MTNEVRTEIESLFNQKIAGEQFTSWGEQYWLQLDPSGYQPQSKISIVTVYPDKEHKIHCHPGYEEIVMGFEGESNHLCNDQEIVLQKGQLGYIRGGGKHRIVNKSGKPAKFISIVTPVLPFPFGELSWIDDVELDELIDSIHLQPIVDRFSRSVDLPVTLVNTMGNQYLEQENLPEFCRLCYRLQAGDCYLFPEAAHENDCTELGVYNCRYSVTSIHSPIIINERLLGYLGCGYGLQALHSTGIQGVIRGYFPVEYYELAWKKYLDLAELSHNHIVSAAETISLVTASLIQVIIFSAREKQMNAFRLKLSMEKQRQAELESSLNEVKLRFLESQVNPHFLFNALNTIAQMAVMEGATTVSSLTYALSNLLRCSLGKNNSLITVKEELEYVNDYLFIQKTRFPHRFEAEIDIEEKVLQVEVPFMMLMVLVENSIIHGFKDTRWVGQLKIKGYLGDEFTVFEVIDNGTGVPEKIIDQFNKIKEEGFKSFSGPKGIGLKNIYNRLEHFFEDRFSLEIQRLEGKGTKVTIKIPAAL